MAERRVSSELRQAALSGARWTGSARFSREITAFAASILLARLVSPAEFGHAAVALIVVALTAILGTAGCTAGLVQHQEVTSRMIGAAVFFSLGVASVFTLATIAVAEVVIRPVFDERTAELVLIASPAWLLVAIGAPSTALLQRNFRFRALAVIESCAALLSAGSALVLAKAGAGGSAIVAGNLVLVGSMGILALAAHPPRTLRTNRAAIRDAVGFATPLTLSSVVYLGYRNIDYAILGARTTPAQLGFYWRAFQLGVGYQSKISQVMQRVSFPVFARASSHEELRALHTRIVRTHAVILVPLLAVFVGSAPVLIPWLFGSTWEPAVVPAQIMAVAGMAEAIITGLGPLMVALGRPAVLLRWNLVVLAAYAVMVFLLAPYGIEAVAVGVACFGALTVVGAQAFIRRPYAGLTFGDLWVEIRPGIVVGVGLLLVAVAVRMALEAVELRPFLLLALLGIATALAYWALLRGLFPAALADLRAIAAGITRRSSDIPAHPVVVEDHTAT